MLAKFSDNYDMHVRTLKNYEDNCDFFKKSIKDYMGQYSMNGSLR